jgi:CheY-like chemotaxis protein
MRVLVIDDDAAFVGMVRAALEEQGHTVATAGDGGSALAQAKRQAPDAIVLDLRMPATDGRWFMRAYARRPGRHAPIVVVSGQPPDTKPPIAGAFAYLRKPFELDRLMGVLDRIAGEGHTA